MENTILSEGLFKSSSGASVKCIVVDVGVIFLQRSNCKNPRNFKDFGMESSFDR